MKLSTESWHDYDSFMPHMNWRDFSLVTLDVEWDHRTDTAWLHVALAGVHLRFNFAPFGARHYDTLHADPAAPSAGPAPHDGVGYIE